MDNTDKKDLSIENNKDLFAFQEIDHTIFDKKFEGKPRGFLSDAIIRFAKNKVNVVAFFIVVLFVMLAIFVPILSTKDFTSATVKGVRDLPPRVPLLELLGIADGTVQIDNAAADVNNINGNNVGNVMFPLDTSLYDPQYIKDGTVVNGQRIGTEKKPEYVGGTNLITLMDYKKFSLYNNLSLTSGGEVVYDKNGAELNANVIKIFSGDSVILNLASIDGLSQLTVVFVELDEDNSFVTEHVLLTTTPDILHYSEEVTINATGYIELQYEMTSEEMEKRVAEIIDLGINSPIIGTNGEPISRAFFTGYNLSMFASISRLDEGGSWRREGAIFTTASFIYYAYNRVFQPKVGYDLATSEFETYLEDYPEMKEEYGTRWEEILLMAENFTGNQKITLNENFVFESDGIPVRVIEKVIISRDRTALQQVWVQIIVSMDGAFYYGFDSVPYFLFGTDGQGRDLFALIWLGLRTSLLLGLIVSVINIIVGVIYGAIEGYYGGKVDFIMERFAEYVASFPGLTILSILYYYYGPGLMLLLVYMIYDGWVGTASTTRIQFYRYRGREYVLASRTLGASDMRLIFKHILPNGLGIIITRSILSIPGMIFVEASLSFLGFGIGHGTFLDFGLFKVTGLSLGVILQDGFAKMLNPGMFYQMLIPSIVIIILMISFNMFGNALRDAVNPTLRGGE